MPPERTAKAPRNHRGSTRPTARLSNDVLSEEEHRWDVVYTDGACTNNGKGPRARAGVGVWFSHDDARNIKERCPGAQTNNRAELIAIIRALETVQHTVVAKPLLIKTDSTYAIDCVTKWIDNWRRNGWKNANRQPVANQPLVQYLDALLRLRAAQKQDVRLQHVKGHSGDRGNDGADTLAVKGTSLDERPDPDWAGKTRDVLADIESLKTRPAPTAAVSMVLGASSIDIDDAEWAEWADNGTLDIVDPPVQER